MDEKQYIFKYIILGLLLLCSFYFSGSETAIFSLNRLERNSLKKDKSKKKKHIIGFLLDNQEQLLITILTGNMVVNIFASSLGSEIGEHIFKGGSELLSILGMTLLLLIVGELTPKRIAVNHSRGFTSLIASSLYYLHHILFPVRWVLNHISVFVLKIFPKEFGTAKETKHALVLSTAELGYNQNILKHSEYRLFKSYLDFKDKTAHGVMTPRNELKTLPFDMSIKSVIDLIAVSPEYVVNSSVILFKEDIDHLFGWVKLTSLLECKFENIKLNEPVAALAKEFHSVPESKDLPTLIMELRNIDTDIVQLVDEYGGTAGVLWFRNIIEDVLKAFYAPNREKFDEDAADSQIIAGSMPIDELEEYLEIEIDDDVDTAAGLFMKIFGDIPVPGDEIRYQKIVMRILTMEGNKITSLQLETETES